jgi:hypothetical protein
MTPLGTYLVNEYSDHIALATFQRTESAAEIELNFVLLAFHTHSQKDAPIGIEIEPYVMHEEVSETLWIKADVFSPNRVVLSHQRTISNADHQPEGLLY